MPFDRKGVEEHYFESERSRKCSTRSLCCGQWCSVHTAHCIVLRFDELPADPDKNCTLYRRREGFSATFKTWFSFRGCALPSEYRLRLTKLASNSSNWISVLSSTRPKPTPATPLPIICNTTLCRLWWRLTCYFRRT